MLVTGIVASRLVDTVAAYEANAVTYDGVDQYLSRTSALSGAADSKQMTFSVWLNFNQTGTQAIFRFEDSGSDRGKFEPNNSELVYIRFRASSGYAVEGTGTTGLLFGWTHVLFSFDLTDSADRHVYVNDSSESMTWDTYTNTDMILTYSDILVGGRSSGSEFGGCMAELWYQPGLYLDLSVEATRRNFIDANGKPVDLDGYQDPLVYLKGDASGILTNSGSGGDFTSVVNGPLVDCDNSPSDDEQTAYTIEQSSDDADEWPDFSIGDTNNALMQVPQSGYDKLIGFRFQDLAIPPGSDISSATISIAMDDTQSSKSVNLTISGEDIDDAPTFTESGTNIADRTLTTASVSWEITDWTAGTRIESPDISSIIQEIVDRAGWASDNNLVIIIEGLDSEADATLKIRSYDDSQIGAPRLEFELS